MSLFEEKAFISHAGLDLTWKVECDALTDNDWYCLARRAYELLPHGQNRYAYIPKGGYKFFKAYTAYIITQPVHFGEKPAYIIFDDVYTTGRSMGAYEFLLRSNGYEGPIIGCVVFARQTTPIWIEAIWVLNENIK